MSASVNDPDTDTPAMSQAPLSTWEWDADTDQFYVGPELRPRFNLGAEQGALSRSDFFDLLHPEDAERLRGQLFRAFEHAQPFEYRVRLAAGPAGDGVLYGHANAVVDADGATLRVLATARDLHDGDPCSNDGLVQRNQRIQETLPEGFFVINPDGEFLDANPTYLAMLGYTREELLERRLFDIEENLEENTRRRLQWTLIDGEMRYHTRHRSKGGRWIDVELATRAAEADGKPFVYGLVRDIDTEVRLEEENRRFTNYLQLLLNSAGEGIYSVDLNGRCTFMNRAGLDMLGYNLYEVLGRNMHELIHHTQDEGPVSLDQSAVTGVLAQGRGVRIDDEVIWRKNGSSFAADYSLFPLLEKGRITGAVVVFRDVTEARSMAMQLEYQAGHDALTGLANRREFQTRLENALQKAKHERRTHVLLFLDLDQFKVVNDGAGHQAGDELLRTLSSQLEDLIRKGDTLARLGGDEFGVLLENCNLEVGQTIAEKIRKAVREFRFSWEDNVYTIGVSIGLVVITAETPSVTSAMSAADAACYSAKDLGRNRVRIYSPDDTQLIRRQGDMRWIGQVHQALKEGRLQLFYQLLQPISEPDHPGLHMEMLLKMKDFYGKLIPPGAFLPAAERAGLTPEIDRWVIKATFDWLGRMGRNIDQIGLVSINLSGHSLSDKSFLEFVVNLIESADVSPHKLCFEVTETSAIANLGNARHLFTTLSQLGCRFALDDFGTGMSSYGYLKTLPVDYLKIDGSFVKDIVTDPIDLAMVKSINDIGHVMGKRTIAEFVENEEILERLKELRVDYAQGYHIAREKPIEELVFAPENKGKK